MQRRLPIESSGPVITFAAIRLVIVLGSLLLLLLLGFPYQGRIALALGALALPFSAAVLMLARGSPEIGFSAFVVVGDLAVLLIVELVAPNTYGAVRFAALFFIAVHSHFQGQPRAPAIGIVGTLVLVAGTAARGDRVVHGDLLAFYEAAFVISGIAEGLILGRLRSAESASRLRARGVTRRTIEAERGMRRRLAQSLHDGPVQELIGLGMVLSAASQAAERGQEERLRALLAEGRELTERNVRALRDEMVDLGPHAFRELTYATVIQNCVPVWQRRYGMQILLQLEEVELPPYLCDELFHITQEAVINAGRHAEAKRVSITLRTLDGRFELRVMDDGKGFGDVDPLGGTEFDHFGLASIRERAELLDGELQIESSEQGTKLVLSAPLDRRGRAASRQRD